MKQQNADYSWSRMMGIAEFNRFFYFHVYLKIPIIKVF